MKKIIIACCLVLSAVFSAVSLNAQESYQPLMLPETARCRSGRCGHVSPIDRPVVVFVPRIIVHPNYQPITIRDLSIKTDIIGNVANTTYEMVMYNPNSATLEAEFEFPLNENQTVAAVALDIGGKMREGVVVEKEKARQTFEAVVRQGVDPLLVEKTAGNQFKTRIYPFAPNGTRKIRIVLEEALQKENGQFKYVLPLNFAQQLDRFNLDINLPAGSGDAPQVTTNLPNFHFTRAGHVFQSHFSATDYDLNNILSFNIPQTGDKPVFTHQTDDGTYFYGNIDLEPSDKIKTLPKTVAIVWDASLSGSKRNISKEKELLTAYFKHLGNASVVFVPFDIKMGTSKKLSVINGNADAVLSTIDDIIYDGATRFDTLDLTQLKVDEILLFTDGLNTFGKAANLTLPNVPVYTINSATEYATGLLKGWATKTFGIFINLAQTDIDQAIKLLTHQPLRVISYRGTNVSDVYPPVGTVAGESINIAGIFNRAQTELEIALGYDGNHTIQTKKITLTADGYNPAVERLWAEQKIAYLEQDADLNHDEILALGQKYSIVTENTSLLVLENASDYFRYHITPPAELRAEYNRLVENHDNDIKRKKESALRDTMHQARQVKTWWNRKFETHPIRRDKYARTSDSSDSVWGSVPDNRPRRRRGGFLQAVATRLVGDYVTEDTAGSAEVYEEYGAVGDVGVTMQSAPERASAPADDLLGTAVAQNAKFDRNGSAVALPSGSAVAPQPRGSIQIKQWDPSVPYLKILKASKDSELYADYLKLKTGYSDQPSFYFDITDEFIRRNQYADGLKVLSNIAEMKLDNVELIRITANKLLQMKEYNYAVELFEKITKLRGEDPQSFRDLALAYQEKGDYQKAFDTFYYILENEWGRFNDIKQIIFVEMNNLLSLHPDVDTKDMDTDLIFNMPVDIRIVLAWSTDNTDIDLHVIDPYKEECFYGHSATQIGGRYPHDFTQGFGPEEFMLKKAANGKYIIRTNNFGDHRQSISGATTLYLDLYTNYSRPDQKHERVFVRTENVKEKNAIGEITWE